MTDLATAWDGPTMRGDWFVANGGLASDAGIHSAVMVSLFTWQRAAANYAPPAGTPLRTYGHWSDSYTGRQLGSRLWQLRRMKKTNDTTLLTLCESTCADALQWLIDDGVASAVRIRATWHGPWIGATTIDLAVEVQRPGDAVAGFQFAWAWG